MRLVEFHIVISHASHTVQPSCITTRQLQFIVDVSYCTEKCQTNPIIMASHFICEPISGFVGSRLPEKSPSSLPLCAPRISLLYGGEKWGPCKPESCSSKASIHPVPNGSTAKYVYQHMDGELETSYPWTSLGTNHRRLYLCIHPENFLEQLF